ncbi:MAG: hypothetical protein OXF74_08235 [Rhodobacteraceae bacterium]|nr:hypothetical protein [Paracoccaceae bacterium]
MQAKRLAVYTARREKLEAEIAALEGRRMSPGNLLTGGLRRREDALLEREKSAAEREAAVSGAEQTAAAAAAAEMNRCALAVQAITEEIAVPGEEPGIWCHGRGVDLDVWRTKYAAALLPPKKDARPWPVALWNALRDFAVRIAEPLRQLRADLDAAITARTKAENDLGTARKELELRLTAAAHTELTRKLAAAEKRILELEPPPPRPDPSPSYDPF